MKQIALIMLLSSLIVTPSLAKTQKKESKLFLVGGGLKTCTSMAIKNCNNKALLEVEQLKSTKAANLYQINQKKINLVKKYWVHNTNIKTKTMLLDLLERVFDSNNQRNISLKKLKSTLKKYDRKKIIQQFTDPEYYTLLDLLEQSVVDVNTGERLKEHVDLANSTNLFSTHLYYEFVKQAKSLSGKKSPKIIVLTASARDPFEAADFYQTVFQQAGADAKWLPFDATLNEAMQLKGSRQSVCNDLSQIRERVQGSLNRELVYPDLTALQMEFCMSPQLIIDSIKKADGVFINGGDQSLTLKAFINHDGSDNAVLTLIKNKIENGKFIIGGTSAGTAVMSGGTYNKSPVVMITNGQSSTAIIRGSKKDSLPTEGCQKSDSCNQDLLNDDLTYNSQGGLGLFRWGIMDTHFSERGRQGRLAQLSIDTNVRFAFGVDESTALIVSNISTATPSLSVIGQGGVFIVENSMTRKTNRNSVKSHYMTFGDTAKIDDKQLSINIADWKKNQLESVTIPKDARNIFDRDRYQKMAEILCRSNAKNFTAIDKWRKRKINVDVEKLPNESSNYGTIKVGDKTKDYCSYKNYVFSFYSE